MAPKASNARAWSCWDSENSGSDTDGIIGKWFKRTGKRNEIFLATKFGFVDTISDPLTNKLRTDPENVFANCESSLKRLQMDWIDLFYCRRVDGKTVQAMAELKKQGKIKYVGLSEVSSKSLRRAHAVHPISTVQVEYSPFSLHIEDPQIDLLSTCKELGVAIIAYSPLGRGFQSGGVESRGHIKRDWRELLPRYSEENFPKSMTIVEKIKAVAKKKGVTMDQVTPAWLMAQWEDVIPIPGTLLICVLEENVEAMKIKLTKKRDRGD